MIRRTTRPPALLATVACWFLVTKGCRAFRPPSAPAVERTKQTLTFPDGRTGVTVHLVGSMHYNPFSIAKTSDIIRSYGEAGSLGSVVVEQCPTRWEKVSQVHPPGSVLRSVLDNEMQAAAEAGEAYGIPTVLGDEEILAVDKRVKKAFVRTAKDLVNPLGGGWESIAGDIRRAYAEAVDPTLSVGDGRGGGGDDDGQYLGALDLLDPRLLLAAPLSFLRYPLAILIKTPAQGAILLGLLTFLTMHGPAELMADASPLGEMSILDIVVEILEGAAAFTVETIFLARIFLTVLLVERNLVLARNIRAECIRLAGEGGRKGAADKVCVAVLGMAHCNGVKSILVDGEGRI